MTVRVRIAPSPTGDPHVGTAYVALFNAALARQRGGSMVLRIEDTDRGRYVANSEQQIFDTLHWLGLDWDEGPDKGGPKGPYRQSERLPIYRQAAERLLAEGHAYYCWCSPERLQEMRAVQTANKQPPGYDRLCVGKTRDERARLPGFDPTPVIRMRVPDQDVPLTFNDLIRGPTNAPMPDDQVILKKDGFPTYHLAVVVDDHEMDITHVLRAEEWISSMPKQLLLYRFFSWDAPAFAHLPLLRNPDRSKISKRKNPAARLLWFQEEGYLPEALLNFLALQGWSMPDGREIFSFDDVVANFDVERFSPVGPIFDIDKLDWMNAEYIKALSDAEFVRRCGAFLPGPEVDPGVLVLAPELKTRVKRLKEVCEQVEFLYQGKIELDVALFGTGNPAAPAALLAAESALEPLTADRFDVAAIESALEAAREQRDWKKGPFYGPIRIGLTGKTRTPPNFPMLAALGRERSLARLRDAIAQLNHA
ncbi:MAG: glutamate--tRNA ligase [Chloroflexi bacterium]|nr:glutamate--tRNA ligase [Chloroflexota bacterium]MBV9601328.1 glutamate--tRNA ligase [Chloroflexota bacterium]